MEQPMFLIIVIAVVLFAVYLITRVLDHCDTSEEDEEDVVDEEPELDVIDLPVYTVFDVHLDGWEDTEGKEHSFKAAEEAIILCFSRAICPICGNRLKVVKSNGVDYLVCKTCGRRSPTFPKFKEEE